MCALCGSILIANFHLWKRHEPGRQTEGYSSSYHLPPSKLRLLDNARRWCLPILGYFSERGDADGMNVRLCWLLCIAERISQTGRRNIQTQKAHLGTATGIKNLYFDVTVFDVFVLGLIQIGSIFDQGNKTVTGRRD